MADLAQNIISLTNKIDNIASQITKTDNEIQTNIKVLNNIFENT